MEHGTRNAYLYHKCRCDECKQSNYQYVGKPKMNRKISAHDEWIRENVREDRIVACKKCKTLIDRLWIHPDYDNENMCGPCLNRSRR